MTKNERTSPRVAKLAARILALKTPARNVVCLWRDESSWPIGTGLCWRDIRAIALTQTPDRPKPKRIPVTDTPAAKKRKPKTHKWTRHRR